MRSIAEPWKIRTVGLSRVPEMLYEPPPLRFITAPFELLPVHVAEPVLA